MYYIALGASAGGQKPLCEFFKNLSCDTGAAYFVVTHLYRGQISVLDTIIQRYTEMKVIRVDKNVWILPNTIYVLAENTMMTISGNQLKTRRRTELEVINQAIDIFFLSLAINCRERAIGIILSGTGSDGTAGSLKIGDKGGRVFVQHPDSSSFDGMPNSVIRNDDPVLIGRPADLALMLPSIIQHKPPAIVMQ